MDRKDRFGEALRNKALVEENLYFARQQAAAEQGESPSQQAALPEAGRCPRCHLRLQPTDIGALHAHRCPHCGGLWLDRVAMRPFPVPPHEDWIAYIGRFYSASSP